MSVRVEGIDKIQEALRKALLNHKPAEVRKALTRAGNVIVDEAKGRAPSSKESHKYVNAAGQTVVIPPGTLRNNIKILPTWSKNPAAIYVGPRIKRRGKNKGGIEPYYAHFVEYGVARHNLGFRGKYVQVKGREHRGFDARPYMRPALDTKGKQAIEVAMVDIEKMIFK